MLLKQIKHVNRTGFISKIRLINFFEYDRTAIKLTPVYMDGKGKYKNKEKEISKNIAAYKAGGKGRQTKVIYCFDCDDYNTKQEDDPFFWKK